MKLSAIQESDNRTEKKSAEVSVVVPVFRPQRAGLEEMVRRLYCQTIVPARVLLVHTMENSEWKDIFKVLPEIDGCTAGAAAEECRASTDEIIRRAGEKGAGHIPETVRLIERLSKERKGLSGVHIPAACYDHAFTRDMAARMCSTDIVVFMTMDALPSHSRMLENLCASFDDDDVWCAFARQLPGKEADTLERFTRSFNYPEQSRTARKSDIKRLGIKTFFCSNACAAYRMDRYIQLGGFKGPALFNEDMVFAGKVIENGGAVRYCASAMVYHTHNYTALKQFKRNFDLGVSQACNPGLFNMEGTASESEGIKMITSVASSMAREGDIPGIFRLLSISAFKYAGYFLGKRFRKLPGFAVRRFTSNPGALFWRIEGISKKIAAGT